MFVKPGLTLRTINVHSDVCRANCSGTAVLLFEAQIEKHIQVLVESFPETLQTFKTEFILQNEDKNIGKLKLIKGPF